MCTCAFGVSCILLVAPARAQADPAPQCPDRLHAPRSAIHPQCERPETAGERGRSSRATQCSVLRSGRVPNQRRKEERHMPDTPFD
jgi:hypothetical protein